MASKRKDMTLDEKVKILRRYEELNLNLVPQRKAAAKLGVSQSALSKWLKNRQNFKKTLLISSGSRKRKREGKNHSVDKALLLWFRQATLLNAPVSRGILLEKANDLAFKMGVDFKATDGWLTRWKERHGVVYKKLDEKKQDCDQSATISWLNNVWTDVLKNYNPNDIFNTDETAVYYRATPDCAMAFKNAEATGCKTLKDQLTVLLTCNMTGSIKMKPLVIGKSKIPRCFKGVKNLPTDYASNKNAWMTSGIFENYLRNWNSNLRKKNKKIALLLDNCPAHPIMTLSNIELIFLPPNTCLIQPLNQGIIKAWKTLFRTNMRWRIIAAFDEKPQQASEVAKKISVLDALHLTLEAWNQVSTECIENCFEKFNSVVGKEVENTQSSDEYCDEEIENWVKIDDLLPTSAPMTEDDIIEKVINEQTTNSEEEFQPVSKKEAIQAVTTLRQFFEQKGNDSTEFDILNILEDKINSLFENNLNQRKLVDFLNKNI